ncbi:MAG: hypothetical protein V3U37_06715, partial [Nitrospinaceae bacterium]
MPLRLINKWKLVHILVFLLSLGLCFGTAFAGTGHEGGHKNTGAEKPQWLDKLENQVNYEEVMGGLDGRQDRLNQTYMKLMGQLQDKIMEHADPASSGGGFHGSWAAHQLGQSYLLGPTEAGAQVFKGAHCPSSAPVKKFDITAINVEITLNAWGDYFPGYMYVLTKNIKQVRADEKKNAEARKDELDSGALNVGLQGDIIQPLAIRGNQGDCV